MRVTRDPAVLASIHEPGVELALWQRADGATAPWRGWLDTLSVHALPACRLRLAPEDARAALQLSCDASGTPAGPAREAFVADVVALVDRFAAVSGGRRVQLRLDVVHDDACRRWHRDCVPARLVCTYRGPATQWVTPERGADVIMRPDEDTPHALQMGVMDAALFKGQGWPDHRHDGGIVHRSPRIAGTAQVRLVLVLDAARA